MESYSNVDVESYSSTFDFPRESNRLIKIRKELSDDVGSIWVFESSINGTLVNGNVGIKPNMTPIVRVCLSDVSYLSETCVFDSENGNSEKIDIESLWKDSHQDVTLFIERFIDKYNSVANDQVYVLDNPCSNESDLTETDNNSSSLSNSSSSLSSSPSVVSSVPQTPTIINTFDTDKKTPTSSSLSPSPPPTQSQTQPQPQLQQKPSQNDDMDVDSTPSGFSVISSFFNEKFKNFSDIFSTTTTATTSTTTTKKEPSLVNNEVQFAVPEFEVPYKHGMSSRTSECLDLKNEKSNKLTESTTETKPVTQSTNQTSIIQKTESTPPTPVVDIKNVITTTTSDNIKQTINTTSNQSTVTSTSPTTSITTNTTTPSSSTTSSSLSQVVVQSPISSIVSLEKINDVFKKLIPELFKKSISNCKNLDSLWRTEAELPKIEDMKDFDDVKKDGLPITKMSINFSRLKYLQQSFWNWNEVESEQFRELTRNVIVSLLDSIMDFGSKEYNRR
eukprot:TRINITY_DN1472_c2_g2_i2.p1 TRINITY_DN1472_c2_g2~~TRINITY_DN1472_c2_g2_i2.p1  ORF type:complete len:504 (+),score=140.49 TRINITY_DN1472_c2_g2_i2:442-1953(+)